MNSDVSKPDSMGEAIEDDKPLGPVIRLLQPLVNRVAQPTGLGAREAAKRGVVKSTTFSE